MKKLFFTLALALGVFTSAVAQEPGQMWVGGSLGFWSSKTKGSDSNVSYKILPEFGYVLTENLGIGINVGFEHDDALAIDGMDDLFEADGFTIAPFVRYSFLKGSIGALFVDGGVTYNYLKLKDVDDKLNQFNIGFRPGVAVKVSDKIALTGKFGFLGYEHTKMGDVKNNAFGLNLDMTQFLLGATIVF